ncbi:hypothetical protein RB195_017220 [Necator americanus]|uniref:Uncharacterized protein n=2 Tax=Necator americanus TaxID=51031 RepID=W2SLS3_NECAM|nr:hypothetical protein NECAME_05114 [Necator americanus]ETN69791.1 hypothetical protein NECAME_05114 [Necator americanus]
MIYLFVFLVLVTAVVAQSSALDAAKMDNLTAEADELVREFNDSGMRITSKIRTRLVVLLLRVIPAEIAIHRLEDPELQQKLDNIIFLLEKKMRINYTAIKHRISNIVTRFLSPALVPFALMQVPTQEEIQQALLAVETRPTYRDIQYPPASSTRLTSDPQNPATNHQTLSNPPSPFYQPQYLPAISQQRSYQPQLTYLSANQYPQDYEYSGVSSASQYYGNNFPRQYYWPGSQYSSYQPRLQQQHVPQYYWQQSLQPTQQRQPSYYWDFSTGNTYYDQNSVLEKY